MKYTHKALTASVQQTNSDLRTRLEAAGFVFADTKVYVTDTGLELAGTFSCVCGKLESFSFAFSVDSSWFNPYQLLLDRGAFSPKHLEHDGYSPEEISSILKHIPEAKNVLETY